MLRHWDHPKFKTCTAKRKKKRCHFYKSWLPKEKVALEKGCSMWIRNSKTIKRQGQRVRVPFKAIQPTVNSELCRCFN